MILTTTHFNFVGCNIMFFSAYSTSDAPYTKHASYKDYPVRVRSSLLF